MSRANRIERIASQLLGDLEAVDSVVQSKYAETQQKLQLILDAFERVGEIALAHQTPPEVCRCGEYETCDVCLAGYSQSPEINRMRDSLV